MKPAAGWPRRCRRHLAGDGMQPCARRVDARDRGEQSLGVGMRRALEERVSRRRLDDTSRVHHDDAIGVARDDSEVVRDQQHRHAQLVLQAVEELEDLGLNRHVERGRRFVRDQDLGVTHERHRDHDPLAHAARQLMGVVVDALLGVGNADQAQHLDRPGPRGAARQVLMDNGGFGNLIPDREHGVQRGHRLLKDHRDLIATNRAQLGCGQRQQIAAFEFDQTAGKHVARRLRHETEN